MAGPSFDYDELRSPPSVDTRIIEEITKSPRMRAEQRSDWMGSYGGPHTYIQLRHLPVTPRLVYAAVLEGKTTSADIESATGLKTSDVSEALVYLQDEGLVSEVEVV